jgi:hypothetical protein
MRHTEVLGQEEIKALAKKWWGNAILPQHYFDALREAAQIGAARAADATQNEHDDQAEWEETMSIVSGNHKWYSERNLP